MTASSVDLLSAELMSAGARLEALSGQSSIAQGIARLVGRLGRRLARPPRIVLLGEFNAGKTTLANALIGAEVLPTSFHANTRIPIHVRYSARPSITIELADRHRVPLSETTVGLLREGQASTLHVGLAVERLRQFELIDTPGLASGMTLPGDLTLQACRSAHMAIWCTAATQAWKASEAKVWSTLPERLRRNSLLVATLADTLNTERDRGRVEARLRTEVEPLFSGLVLVAAAEIDALRRDPDAPDHADRWIASGGAALDAGIERLIAREQALREAATRRILSRAAARHGKIDHSRTGLA